MKIQLLSFPGCPNVNATRETLRRCLAAAGLPQAFEEVDVTAPKTPAHLRDWGSPTILVNDADVAGELPAGVCCRLYPQGGGDGGPSADMIHRALARLTPRTPSE